MTAPAEQGYGQDGYDAAGPRGRGAEVSLSEYAAMLRRRWKAITAGVLIGLLLAVPAYALTSKTYEAKVLVALAPTQTPNSNGGTNRTDVNTNTERGIASSTAVATRVKDELAKTYEEYRSPDVRPGQLLRRLTVTVPTSSQTLEFRFRATGNKAAAKAAAGVNAFAAQYLTLRSQQRGDANRATADGLQAIRLQRVADVRDRNNQIAAKGTSAAQRSSLSRERNLLQQNIAALQEQEDAIRGASVSAGTLIDIAIPPSGPVAPQVPLYAAAGLILGLLAGLAYALWREHRDDHIREPADLARAGGEPLLATLKVPRRVPVGSGLALLSAPESPEAAGYRLLAAKLQAPSLPVGRSILVTGAHGGDPRVAPNLAVALARLGRSVLLWAPPHTLTSAFGGLGLTEAALPAPGITGTIVALDALPGLSLAPLRDDDLAGAVETSAGAPTDFVLVDDSAAPATWRTLALAGEVDGVVLVATVGRSGRRELRELAEQIDSIGARIIGGTLLVGTRLPAPPAGVRGGALPGPARRPAPAASSSPAPAPAASAAATVLPTPPEHRPGADAPDKSSTPTATGEPGGSSGDTSAMV